MNKIQCAYCGAEKQEVSFFIGAAKEPDWTMIYGTGKITCPDCYNVAEKEGKERIEKHIKEVNAR